MEKNLKRQIQQLFDKPTPSMEAHQKWEEFCFKHRVARMDLRSLEKQQLVHYITALSPQRRELGFYSSQAQLSPYELAHALCRSGYFCNLTAIFYHQLTNQVPRVIYMAKESKGRQVDLPNQKKKIHLTDHQIFQAFLKPHRYTKNIYSFSDYKIAITERPWRDEIGVEEVQGQELLPKGAYITSLERTLIDACVAPHYNGGIASVLDYYRIAVKCRIDVKEFIHIYQKLFLIYPYWQAIGFLADRAGLTKLSEALLDTFTLQSKFCLDHEAKTTWKYDEKWKLYYPEGLK